MFGFAIDLFYRRRLISGEVPSDRPVLLVVNHPNGLVDPAVVMRTVSRTVSFLAKEPLFRMPIVGSWLRGVGALPVYRKRDGADTAQNKGALHAAQGLLEEGGLVCLFPEGTSHSGPSLEPLKTGAARLALSTVQAGTTNLAIIPMGLIYRNKSQYRGEVGTIVGTPIDIEASMLLSKADPKHAVQLLTEQITQGLREATVNLRSWDDQPLLELAGAVWQAHRSETGTADPLATLAQFAKEREKLDETQRAELQLLRQSLVSLKSRLQAVGLEVSHLHRRYQMSHVARFVGRNLMAFFVGLPIALLGTVTYAIPYYGVRPFLYLMKPTDDLEATAKILISFVLFPLWQLILTVFLFQFISPIAAILSFFLLPFAGVYTHQFLAGRKAAFAEIQTLLTLPFQRRIREQLKAECRSIATAIESATRPINSVR